METNFNVLKDNIEKGASRRETPRCNGPMKKIVKTAPNAVFSGKFGGGLLGSPDTDPYLNGNSELISNNSRLSKNSSRKSNLLIKLPSSSLMGGQETPPSDKARRPKKLRRVKEK